MNFVLLHQYLTLLLVLYGKNNLLTLCKIESKSLKTASENFGINNRQRSVHILEIKY